MRRSAIILATLVIATSPLAAQSSSQSADPDKKVAGGGGAPKGWTKRFDRPNAKAADHLFAVAGTGLHVTSGPAAILWNPAHKAKGKYEVSAEFTQTKPAAHPEGYGLIVAGSNLAGEKQDYLYFLVRQDGKYFVSHRAGSATHTLVPWTANAAVKTAGANGSSTNVLAVRTATDSVRFLVNGTQVGAVARGGIVKTDGIYGMRVNHNLDMHVERFGLTGAKKK